jgi:hypothetical protein
MCLVCIFLCWWWCLEIETSSIDWTQLSKFLPEDRMQSQKRVLNKKNWMISNSTIIVLIYHRHELSCMLWLLQKSDCIY